MLQTLSIVNRRHLVLHNRHTTNCWIFLRRDYVVLQEFNRSNSKLKSNLAMDKFLKWLNK